MFKRLYKTFYYETFTYTINSPKKTVVEQLDHLLMERSSLFKKPNLNGNFVDYPDTFFITQKWWMVHIRSFEKEPAILKGVISKLSDTKTKIEIAVRPNTVFLIFFLVFLPIGLYQLYQAIITKDLNSALGGIWLTVFILPFLFLIARTSLNRLRGTFEKYLNIKPVGVHESALLNMSV